MKRNLSSPYRWAMRNGKAMKASVYLTANSILTDNDEWKFFLATRPAKMKTRYLGASRQTGVYLLAQESKRQWGFLDEFFFK